MVCNTCDIDKPWKDFYTRKSKKGSTSLRAQCKACNNKVRRKTHLRRAYGISLEDFEDMRVEQENACKICRNPFFGRIDIDHDHKTGKVRGLLCINCNGGLGNFRDSIELLHAAIGYLHNPV